MKKPRCKSFFHHLSLFTLFSLLSVFALFLVACQNKSNEKTASVSSLTDPLPTPTPPQADPRRTEPERFGAGSTLPDFALEDINGRVYRLSDYKGKKNVVLVFYRGYF
ncbi:MAG TPA: hypothetical protein VEF04_02205 [Blastocatellia bacterium]|nr:hypothetical protein [Blastocatellia bacterium]